MTNTPTMSPDRFTAVAHDLADLARAAVLPHFREAPEVENKAAPGSFDPVTAADRAAEAAIAAHLGRVLPDHGVVGEEFGSVNPEAAYRWIVDPIDGTRAFIMGYPLWGTLIGLMHEDRPILGLMDQPFTKERFWSQGGHSLLRIADAPPRRLATRSCARLADAILSTTDPELFAAGFEIEGFRRAKAGARMTRYGGDCYAYAMLAAGGIDAVIEAGLKPHDVVALIPLIEGAGGRITTWDGRTAANGGRIVAAGDPRLHEQLVTLLSD